MDSAIGNVSAHYDEDYFDWQRREAPFWAQANLWMYEDYVQPGDVVVDFGCGGGFLLEALPGRVKIGIDVNPAAQDVLREKGLAAAGDLSAVADGHADVIVSCHALEHTVDPFDKLKLVKEKLRRGGLAVFVVPCERYDTAYVPDNIDQHLYTWAPINIGNLFCAAGFSVLSCERLAHRLPPMAARLQQALGWTLFHALCRAYARLRPKLTQVRVVARKV
jgi:SAM-dependent methyltransferase